MSYPKSNPNHPHRPSFNANSYTSHSSGSGTSPRKTHRKRASALRLSSDTTSSLPEYISIPAPRAGAVGWQHHIHQQHQQGQHPQYLQQHLHSYSGTRLGAGVEEEEDKPPDYPDSAEEADEDTDTDVTNTVYVPLASPSLRPQTASPRRAKRFLPSHKRRQSVSSLQHFQQQQQAGQGLELEPSDPYLDSLLERSVHALEMSNTLLQSSISTQTSLSAILGADSPGDGALEARAVGLSTRIRDTWDVREAWADDLEEISRNVEGLFIEGNNTSPSSRRRYASRSNPAYSMAMEGRGGGISCSLPNSGGSFSSMRRRPSLDLRLESDSAAMPRLHYSQQNRSNLVSPPPRALTQYVASTQDAESILLPSTIGLRSPPSLHPTPDWRPLSDLASSSTTSLLSTQSFSSPAPSKLTDKPLEPSTPAYNMLSSFVYRPTPPGSATPSFMSRRRDSSIASGSTERRSRRSSKSPVPHKSPDINRGVSPIRPMTPPVEEPSSSSSSDGFVAKRTVQSLRKILDDQPPPPPPLSNKLKSPAFMPRTPAPIAEAGTSTATASISRLFTKGKHSSSTRAASPPRQSAMKQQHRAGPSANGSAVHSPALSLSVSTSSTHTAPTPSPLPSPSPYPSTSGEGSGAGAAQTLSIPDLVSKVLKARSGLGLGGGRGSITDAESSGQSTPSKRISFAELPESYASTRPASSRFAKGNKSASRKRKSSSSSNSNGTSGKHGGGAEDVSPSSWWSGWLGPGVGGGSGAGAGIHGLGVSLARHEERVEDRMTRNWGGRMNTGYGSGGLDDWAV